MNSNLTQHFRRDEIPFLKNCDDLVNEMINGYRPILTDFLNPRQAYLLSVVANGYRARYRFFGGYPQAEMQRGLIYPKYFTPQRRDFHVDLINVKYPVKFSRLKHSQILGALMGTGIKRSVIGDILTDGHRWQFLVIHSMSRYLLAQVNRIGHVRVRLVPNSLSQIVTPLDDAVSRYLVVQSLRIDSVIAAGFHVSRRVAKELIQHGRVRLNWEEFERPDSTLQTNDILSVRRYGRIRIRDLRGKSKKGKQKIVISLIKK